MLDHLVRVDLIDRVSGNPLPKEPCWVDQVILDIPMTMLGYIESAPPQVKALTFRPTFGKMDKEVVEACKRKGITVVWAQPPRFIRYLD